MKEAVFIKKISYFLLKNKKIRKLKRYNYVYIRKNAGFSR